MVLNSNSNGDIIWHSLDYVLKVNSHEISYAADLTDHESTYHNLSANQPNWTTVETILKIVFHICRKDFDTIVRELSNNSKGKQFATKFLAEENSVLKSRITHNKSLM